MNQLDPAEEESLAEVNVANLDMDACRAQQFDHRSLSTYLEADLDFDIATFLLPSDKQTQK
ncbi:MAG: hypothetical protein Q9188_004187 [Gyalolechia gomerana]